MPRQWACFRPVCLLLAVALALVGGCTRQAPLEPVDQRVLQVDWAALNLPKLDQDGLTVQGVVFTPAQWPLEASAKRLFDGDFVGVLDAFDLTFSSSSIPDGVLEKLYEEGYVPAYVQVHNISQREQEFLLSRLALQVDASTFFHPVAPENLPTTIPALDLERMGRNIGLSLAALMVVAIVAAITGGRGNAASGIDIDVGPTTIAKRPARDGEADVASVLIPSRETFTPGAAREGVVFFRVASGVRDWRSAQLKGF